MTVSEIIMIRPCSFGFNEQTAESNHFQNSEQTDESLIQQKALEEFDNMVNILREKGIQVTIFEDTSTPHTPDSIFPNNWLATHQDGTIVLFPMEAPNRRLERREDIINHLEVSYRCQRIVDFTDAENINTFLEGTGSIVFDHRYRLAYACRSSRTDERLLKDYCETIDYTPILFDASDENDRPIYHTNVLMNIGVNYVVICFDAVAPDHREMLHSSLLRTNKEIITISHQQMNSFAGNMLQLSGKNGFISLLSQTAFEALNNKQKAAISENSELVSIPIPTIERIGGGSVRCMMAEVFLTKL